MARPRYPVILWDMDGTLVAERSAWEWVHDHFSVDNTDNVQAYLQGYLDDEAFMREDIALWTEANGGPVHVSQVEAVLEEAPLMPGAEELFAELNDLSVRHALVSGGIDLLAHRVARALGIEVVIANTLETDEDGYLTGEGIPRVYLEEKEAPAREALAQLGFSPGDGVGVGNSRYDAGLFRVAGAGIAFAPLDDEVRREADVTVDSHHMADLRELLVEGPR